MKLVKKGPETFTEWFKMMQRQLNLLLQERDELEKSIKLVKRKIAYYEEAIKSGNTLSFMHVKRSNKNEKRFWFKNIFISNACTNYWYIQ